MIDDLGSAYRREVNARELQQMTAGEKSLKEKLRIQMGEIDKSGRKFNNARRAITPRHEKFSLKNIFEVKSENSSETENGKIDHGVGLQDIDPLQGQKANKIPKKKNQN